MTSVRARLGAGILASALLLILAWHLVAPAAVQPQPTAFGDGEGNLSRWAERTGATWDLRAVVSGTYLASTAPDPSATLLVVLAPQRAPTAGEAAVLDAHLSAGGSVWILDPAGAYNDWSQRHGIWVAPHILLDPGSPHGPQVVRLRGGEAGALFEPVLANSSASLSLDEPEAWKVWLRAPAIVHLDITANGTVDRVDTPGPHPVGAVRTFESGGTLLVMSDATLLSNALYDRRDSANEAFVDWLLRAFVPPGGVVLVDESHHGWTAPERLPVAAVASAQPLYGLPPLAGGMLLAALAVAAWLLVRATTPLVPYLPHSRSDPATAPDADPDSLQRMIENVVWEVVAARSRQPVERVQVLGAAAVAAELPDPALRRILLRQAGRDDSAAILREYLGEDVEEQSDLP